MRTLQELTDVDEPGIDLLRAWAGQLGANQNVVLSPDLAVGGRTLERLQVTTRSLLGAVVYETGGLLVDHGRLRVFGSAKIRSILSVNEALGEWTPSDRDTALMIADDILGGLFAVNAGRFGQACLGQVFHLPVDSTKWFDLEIQYSDFISWCLTGDLSQLYGEIERKNFYSAIPTTDMTKTNSFHPFLWTKEGREGKADVRLIDADESMRLRIDLWGYEIQAADT